MNTFGFYNPEFLQLHIHAFRRNFVVKQDRAAGAKSETRPLRAPFQIYGRMNAAQILERAVIANAERF